MLLGPPASGKGTQADRIASRFGIPHVSTGALLRSESARGTPLGLEADARTSRGLLVPDALALRIIKEWMGRHERIFLLDGFPSSESQAEQLNALLEEFQTPLDLIILLELPDEEIRRRIAARLSCLKCGATLSTSLHIHPGDACPRCGEVLIRRNDDRAEALEERLRIYRELTLPVVDYYKRTTPLLLHRLCAEESSDTIFSRISKLVEGKG